MESVKNLMIRKHTNPQRMVHKPFMQRTVYRFKGKEGEQPRISKLGTGAWEKIKERTKTKIKDIARDLIKLYSQRKQEKGFKYSPDSFLQHNPSSFLHIFSKF
jgi:transcription-repair coupling factor (superfamily II helicase)